MRTPDEQSIDAARSAFNARLSDSSLVAWICSKEWAPKLRQDSVTKRWKLPLRFRGLPGSNGSAWKSNGTTCYSFGTVVSGEINAYTRDHVDGFTQGDR